MKRLSQRILELIPRSCGTSLKSCIDKVNCYLRGWLGYFRICTEEGAKRFQRYDARIRRRLRAIIVRQKGKRPRFLYRHLRSCGVPLGLAHKAAFSRRGAWFMSAIFGVHRAYGNVWFARRVVTLWHEWQSLNPPNGVSGEQKMLFST